ATPCFAAVMSESSPTNRFVQIDDAARETNPWTNNEWLCRPDLVEADKLLLVRANMDPMHCHPFHYHPHREEIIYVIYGRAEQWVGHERRILKAGEMAHIPPGVVHATYNPHKEPLVFLAILSPAVLPEEIAADPDPVDVSADPQWSGLRTGLPACTTMDGSAG
ncbi:MAG: cupin domain-containing protein, partial [Verrucomicrobiales bacterium]|nr:cupin domain-containing protein [Verrucomicrobiales bacterium]